MINVTERADNVNRLSSVFSEKSINLDKFQGAEFPKGDTKSLKMVDAAFRAAAFGPVFPLIPRQKLPFKDTHGFHDASDNEAQIVTWWTANPDANVGLRTGSGLLVFDIDNKAGQAIINQLVKKLGPLPDTFMVKTGKGFQLYFYFDPSINITNVTPDNWKGKLDLRGNGGYVVAPGSIHPNGKNYEIHNDAEIAFLPQAWVDHIVGFQSKPTEWDPGDTIRSDVAGGDIICQGYRNDWLKDKVYHLKKYGLDGDVLFQAAIQLNTKHCSPPLSESEVRKMCNSTDRRVQEDPVKGGSKNTIESRSTGLLELCQMDFEEPKWIVDGLLPEGLTIMAAAPKVGKTWLAMDIALRVATGGQVLGKFNVVEPRHVIFFGLEDNKRRFRYRIDKIRKNQEAPSNFLFIEEWDFGKAGREEILAAMTRNSTGLVVIDTLGCARLMTSDPIKKNVSPYQLDYEFTNNIKAIVRQSGGSILMLHHNRKNTDQNDPHLNTSGTQGIFGAADTSWQLMPRTRGSHLFTMAVTGKDVADASLALEWDKERYIWSCAGTTGEVFRSESEQAILAVLTAEPIGPTAIADKAGMNINTVKWTLNKLVEKGYLVKTDKGKYYSIDATIKNNQPTNHGLLT